MGVNVSALVGSSVSAVVGTLFPGPPSPPPPPPKVVLVPPFFQRDVRGLSRFARSSYPYLANRKQLSRLLRDHLSPELRGTLLLSPHDDPRVSVRAKLRQAGGAMVLRWQPASAAALHTFLEMAANLESPGDVSFRGSYLHPETGLGAFLVAPLAKNLSGEAAQVGVRYSSTSLTAGAIVTPRTGQLDTIWLAGRAHGLTLGCQLSPAGLTVRQLLKEARDIIQPPPTPTAAATTAVTTGFATAPAAETTAGGPSDDVAGSVDAGGSEFVAVRSQQEPNPLDRLAGLGYWLRCRSSLLLAYSPPQAPGATGTPFTAAVEMEGGESLTFSFFQHVAATRQVMNPFEEGEVVGITNYLDIGLQLTTPIGGGSSLAGGAAGATTLVPAASSSVLAGTAADTTPPAAAAASGPSKAAKSTNEKKPTIDLAVAWQINKNWLLKGRVGSNSASAAVGARVWHAVSAYLTASVSVDYATRKPRYGAELCVENFGPLRYERGADNVPAGRALLQLHEASPQDLANYAGRGVLVRRHTVGNGGAGAAATPSGALRDQEERRRVAALM